MVDRDGGMEVKEVEGSLMVVLTCVFLGVGEPEDDDEKSSGLVSNWSMNVWGILGIVVGGPLHIMQYRRSVGRVWGLFFCLGEWVEVRDLPNQDILV